MIHRVKLSNGRALLIEEGDECLHIATEHGAIQEEVDMYLCEINRAGVLVMTNSGDASSYVVSGLKGGTS